MSNLVFLKLLVFSFIGGLASVTAAAAAAAAATAAATAAAVTFF